MVVITRVIIKIEFLLGNYCNVTLRFKIINPLFTFVISPYYMKPQNLVNNFKSDWLNRP